jgi:SPP1 family predicted phage head-tail adaptor
MGCKSKCFDFAFEARQKILIETNSDTTDEFGGQAGSWSTVGAGTVWAKVSPASDHTRFISENLQARVTHIFIIRYQSGLADVKDTVKNRITLDSRLFDIMAIKNVDDTLKRWGKAYQIIMADEAGPDV